MNRKSNGMLNWINPVATAMREVPVFGQLFGMRSVPSTCSCIKLKTTGTIFSGVLAFFVLLLSGCTGLKRISDKNYLYSGYTIKIDSTTNLSNPSETITELKSLIELKPNKKFLWMRPALSFYHLIPEPKRDSCFQYWLKYKLGKPPSLVSDLNLSNSIKAIENRLQNRGNFSVKASSSVQYKGRTAKVMFVVSPGSPYTLNSVKYPNGEDGIVSDIQKLYSGSLLKVGATYLLKDFEKERKRIDEELKKIGYYYFNADYLLFTADTMSGSLTMDVALTLKPETPAKAMKRYRYNNVYVNDDYTATNYHPDTTQMGNIYYLSTEKKIKPKTILDAIFFEKEALYSVTDHYNTLRQLMGIGVYKYANARFELADTTRNILDVNLFLRPAKKISLSAELNGQVKSNNFAGPGLNLIYKNRNALHGAELLTITLGESFETQYKGDSKGQTSFQTILDASLSLPKITPINFVRNITKTYVPKTTISAGFGIFSRVDLYRLNTLNTSLGYSWRPNQKHTHNLKPAEVTYTKLPYTTAEFEDYLDQNPTVRKSFEEQFIVGAGYNFTNSNILKSTGRHTLFLTESIDLSGNVISAFTTAINGQRPDNEDPYKLLGLPYSQFVRIKNELRYLYNPGSKHQWAARFIAAAGVPYGNSSAIPYVRQYFVGGTNSIRAFIARALGPGTYKPADESDIYIDQAGDIKLETNVEYRFDIYKYLKGALFADAGNIWLVNEDPTRSGGKFNINSFYREIAVGSGFGLRFDFNYIVLRIDIAVPLCKPYLEEGNRWTLSEFDMGSPAWRKENLVWNFAIGYPF